MTGATGARAQAPPSSHLQGVIDWLSPDLTYGFVQDDAGRAVSLPRSEIDALDAAALAVGQRIQFDLAPEKQIPVAADVRPIYQCAPCKDSGCGWCDWPR